MVFSRILTWRVSRRRWIRWRQCWMSFKGRLRRLDDKLERVKAVRGRTKEWPADPIEFCIQYLGFKPTVYKEKLLRDPRSEEHTSELQSQSNLVCRLLLEKKNKRSFAMRRTLCALK